MYIMYTGISDEMCYCTFRIANMEYAIGTHTLTFQSILNGEVRGSTSTMFIVTDSKLILYTVKICLWRNISITSFYII